MKRGPFDLDRADLALLALGVLALVPGLRAVLAWPWLFFVPGWFVARKVLGARGALLGLLAPALSVTTSWLVCLPWIVIARAPSALGIVLSIAAFAIVCSHRRVRLAVELPEVPWPPLALNVALAGFVALRAFHAFASADRVPGQADGWYMMGVVRSLATSFPPANPIAATEILKQPWGHWLGDALAHVLGHVSVLGTLQIASGVYALAFAAILYAFVFVVSDDRRAAALAVALAFGSSELGWSDEVRAKWTADGVGSFANNLVDAVYDVPVFVVALTALLFLRKTTRASLLAAGLLLAILPAFHPTHALVLDVAIGLSLVFELGRRRVPWLVLALGLAPLPFLVLYVGLYARGMHVQSPFALAAAGLGERAAFFGRWAGLYVPLAVGGCLVTTRALRSTLVALLLVPAALALATKNFANNYHWTYDLLAVAMAVLGGLALSRLVTRLPTAGWVVVAGVLAVATYGAGWHVLVAGDRAWLAGPRRIGTPDENAAAQAIASATSASAVVVADPRSAAAMATVLALAERRLFVGPPYLLLTTTSERDVEALLNENGAMLRSPCAEGARARGVALVLLESRMKKTVAAWRAATPPLFESAELLVFPAACPR